MSDAPAKQPQHYLPSPEEIAEACRQIQSTWSRFEERKRRGTDLRGLTRKSPEAGKAVRS